MANCLVEKSCFPTDFFLCKFAAGVSHRGICRHAGVKELDLFLFAFYAMLNF